MVEQVSVDVAMAMTRNALSDVINITIDNVRLLNHR